MSPPGFRWGTPGFGWGTPGFGWGMTSAAVVAIVVCLAAVDRFLAKVESSEIESAARQSYLKGSRLLEEGKPTEAIDFLRDAHASQRENPQYELQLIAALMAGGKTAEAEPLLAEILDRYSNDGPANLLEARLRKQQGDLVAADAYYHRAIYGEWAGDAAAHRIPARMELIDLLAEKNRKQSLLGELISLEAETPANGEIQKRLGQLFLQADSPARAANVYEALVRKDPKDISAYTGLGEAELEQGHYSAAHGAFLQAFVKDPDNPSVRTHLQTLNTVTDLDPTLRQLTSADKYRRSVRILKMAREGLDRCLAGNLASGSPTDKQLLNDAEVTAAAKMPAHVTNEVAEGVLSLAERLWRAETAACGPRSAEKNALDLIMNKLGS